MLFILFNCGGEVPNLVTEGSANVPVDLDKRDTIWGEGESILFGGDGSPPPAGEGSGIGVNAFLWRASLDIVSNLPIASADPFGGVIITDWYSDQGNTNESIKITIKFLSNEVRSDALDVDIFYKKCVATSNCKINKQEGQLKKEITKQILAKAAIYKKQVKD